MLQRALGVIAGVDRKTLSTCPPSDKLWAAHLGASLCLSFIVVVGVSFHATGYMIANVWTRLLVSGVIGLTVLMFDRALCQSDWFYQGTLWNTAPIQSSTEARQTAWRFVRVGIRLMMSFGLAWVIAMFLELAIFSGTINEKIEADRIAANQPIYAKIAQYEAGLTAEAARRQAGIDTLEALHRDVLTEAPALEPMLQNRTDDIDQQMKALATRESDIRADIGQIDRTIQRYIADMNAEEFGLKAAPNNSGRPGAGPRYEYARKQKEAFIAQRAAREAEIVQLHQKRDELRAAQARVAGDASVSRDQERAAIRAKADALQARIDAARADLKQFEAAKAADVADFRQKALAQSYYQEKKDRIDPLTRIAAYQELKNDPKDGATMTLFSWMTRLFIIFLEIVPVVAKIFFSPPSVYAAKIQAQVERARQRIENNEDLDDDKPAAPAPAPAMATITLPTMSLDAVTMKQPEPQPKASAPEPRAARPSPASTDHDGRHAWPDAARDVYDPRRIDRRDEEIYSRWDDERRAPQRHAYQDRDRRPAARHDFDRDYDRRDFERRNPDRRDYSARAVAPHDEPSGYEAAPRYEPARSRATRFAARDYADDEAVSDHGEPEYIPSELDVRSLIRPRRSAPRRDTMYEADAGETFAVRKNMMPARPVAERIAADGMSRTQAAPVFVADAKVNALVQEMLAVPDIARVQDAASVADLPPMPLGTPSVRPADSLAAAPLQVTAPESVPAEDAPSQSASTGAEEADASLSVVTEATAESSRLEQAPASSAELHPEPSMAHTPTAEEQPPADEVRRETHLAAATGSAAPKYAADVEKLMSEAFELTKVRKKSSRPRREAPVAAEHLSEAELPLGPVPVDTLLPKP
ncbi:DUF4407 domain-containing protein [Rhodopseudomonas sp. HC1]|uniref:DUF4407 domain-containing protein n=1 Tax=Rhodopseudomonas infernalis TaxID=2897386 RepID=UPI001EE8528A|nr:DUF4407 domain-containing protein [Rhodopseudomonas infernalis]MCG6203371.1 DUF4407 domain-containing protein [Rhodopseudomonas infernalis]